MTLIAAAAFANAHFHWFYQQQVVEVRECVLGLF